MEAELVEKRAKFDALKVKVERSPVVKIGPPSESGPSAYRRRCIFEDVHGQFDVWS